jgi:Helix-turn-helix domain
MDVVPRPAGPEAAVGGWGMVTMDPEGDLARGLHQAGIARAPTYSTGQVARVLGVSPETVRRLVDAYEPPGVGNARKRGNGLSGLRAIRIVSHRRIPHDALAEWIRENAAYLRLNRGAD